MVLVVVCTRSGRKSHYDTLQLPLQTCVKQRSLFASSSPPSDAFHVTPLTLTPCNRFEDSRRTNVVHALILGLHAINKAQPW